MGASQAGHFSSGRTVPTESSYSTCREPVGWFRNARYDIVKFKRLGQTEQILRTRDRCGRSSRAIHKGALSSDADPFIARAALARAGYRVHEALAISEIPAGLSSTLFPCASSFRYWPVVALLIN